MININKGPYLQRSDQMIMVINVKSLKRIFIVNNASTSILKWGLSQYKVGVKYLIDGCI